MGMLMKSAILKAIETGAIVCEPFTPENVGSNSLDVCLGDKLLTYTPNTDLDDVETLEPLVLDPRRPNPTSELIIPKTGLVLQPGKLYLGHTVEKVGSMTTVPTVEGRSSLGRLGLFVHVTAGFGDVGFISQWTLELVCVHPIRIYPGMRIAQLAFHTAEGEIGANTYKGKYGQTGRGVEASAIHLDRENAKV